MTGVKVKLKQLSICPCGETVLKNEIKIGAEYVIYPETIRGGYSYFCGKCKKTQAKTVTVVDAEPGPYPLPLSLFDYKSD